MCEHPCVYMHEHSARGGQKHEVPLDLEVNINGLMWVPGIELKSYARTMCVLIDKLYLQPSACFLTQSRPNCLRIASSTVEGGPSASISNQGRSPQTCPKGSLMGQLFNQSSLFQKTLVCVNLTLKTNQYK